MVAEVAGLCRASAGAGDRIPPVGKVDAGAAGEGVEVDDRAAGAESREVEPAAVGGRQGERRHRQTGQVVGGTVVLGARQVGGEGGVVGGRRRTRILEAAGRALFETAGQQRAARGEGGDGLVEFGDALAVGGQGSGALVAVLVAGVEALDERGGPARRDADVRELTDLGDGTQVLVPVLAVAVRQPVGDHQAEALVVAHRFDRDARPLGEFADLHPDLRIQGKPSPSGHGQPPQGEYHIS